MHGPFQLDLGTNVIVRFHFLSLELEVVDCPVLSRALEAEVEPCWEVIY